MDDVESGGPSRVLESLADRLGVSPWSVLAAPLAVVAAAIGGWWALASPGGAPAEEMLPRVDEVPALVASTTTTVAPETDAMVHVDGAVVVPGVHEVAPGSRVVDAIDAAGGLTPDADRGRLNLAQPVVDGQRIWVPVVGEDEPQVVVPEGGGVESGDGAPTGGLIDLNDATLEELETLPGVGPTLGQAIIDHREREGPFRSIEQLLDVSGIGPSRLEQIKPLATV